MVTPVHVVGSTLLTRWCRRLWRGARAGPVILPVNSSGRHNTGWLAGFEFVDEEAPRRPGRGRLLTWTQIRTLKISAFTATNRVAVPSHPLHWPHRLVSSTTSPYGRSSGLVADCCNALHSPMIQLIRSPAGPLHSDRVKPAISLARHGQLFKRTAP